MSAGEGRDPFIVANAIFPNCIEGVPLAKVGVTSPCLEWWRTICDWSRPCRHVQQSWPAISQLILHILIFDRGNEIVDAREAD
jgi:hypothetical protein